MFDDNIPIFTQIIEIIKNNIIKGNWKEEEKIPSVRKFAMELEVNPNTVMNALKELQREEILENKRGIGNIVMKGAREKIIKAAREDFFNNSLNDLVDKAKIIDVDKGELFEAIDKIWDS